MNVSRAGGDRAGARGAASNYHREDPLSGVSRASGASGAKAWRLQFAPPVDISKGIAKRLVPRLIPFTDIAKALKIGRASVYRVLEQGGTLYGDALERPGDVARSLAPSAEIG
jgi:hypothetical protein